MGLLACYMAFQSMFAGRIQSLNLQLQVRTTINIARDFRSFTKLLQKLICFISGTELLRFLEKEFPNYDQILVSNHFEFDQRKLKGFEGKEMHIFSHIQHIAFTKTFDSFQKIQLLSKLQINVYLFCGDFRVLDPIWPGVINSLLVDKVM